ncbi:MULTISPECIES: DUF4209 domain-containing protein [Moorena]|uniref:Uncharacterized protein n=1 Tax=Moorena producens 3L TaxID=489825 RepID=F4XXH3_9CYAN|nr:MULTISPECIES: DUF4209 domain-containing protein [Moorena]EGJ30651.1 hypothetical protein LYNGBM3L_47470 [Moorena producens 3L]NEP64598.1 DUF4209 domain-containing protein [Moorena sp. SIO3A5]NEQ10819.1 DUF4209 domain-containing protein [Moorena sp. SIO4E2]NES40811.1 DUF4209 domain-containing protein [Moorena sp. SIO2C4]OLT67870.1 hypothetical protein BI334_25095 [Moorena producens 3L]
MSELNPPLKKNDFTNTCWQDVVNSSEPKNCITYCIAFDKKVQEAQESGNFTKQAVFEILAAVTNAPMNPALTEELFTDRFKNLTEEQLNFLAEIAPEISDPELQARVADILWVRRRDDLMAQLSITAYLQSATTLESSNNWKDSLDRIERAFRLERQFKNKDKVVFKHIEAVLECYEGEDSWWPSPRLMELLQEHKCGEPVKYAALAEKAANLAESSSNWAIARRFWSIKAKWHRMDKDYSKELAASMSAAETYVKEADSALKRTPPSYMAASGLLQQAVKAFRSIRGTKEETVDAKARAEELHRLLLQYQEESRNEMMTISHKMDISKVVEEAINSVKGKDFKEALFALSVLAVPTNVSKLRQQVQQDAHNSLGIHLVPINIINEMGKTVAIQPASVLSSDPEEAERATNFYMCQKAIEYYHLQAQAYIEPARYQINLEHCVRLNDILFIVRHSPFIPPQREYLFAKGLYAGLTGDFFTSTHILIPQIENSIRYIMWQRGIITSKLKDKGIQDEFSLSKTLAHSKITSIFDETMLFELKCLLVEHAGSNLRNRMAHGLISDGDFMSPLMSYVWCLTLRLCCLPMLIHQQQVEQSKTSTDAI